MQARPDPYLPTMVRYVVAATLARGADAGAAVGLVLLAVAYRPAPPHAAAVGGVLAAGLVVPHALGPFVARRLDLAADGRRVLAAAYTVYGAAVAGAAFLLGRVPVPLVLAVVVAGGTCGPLLTGGLSSRLPGIAGAEGPRLRRAQGWDAVTYGLAGTLGPLSSPRWRPSPDRSSRCSSSPSPPRRHRRRRRAGHRSVIMKIPGPYRGQESS